MTRSRINSCFLMLLWAVVACLVPGCERQESPSASSTPQAAASPSSDPGGGLTTPNVVFVLIDTLRADRLSCYGASEGTTPSLDRLAAESVVFERCIAPAPWTQPSVASMFCSRYPGVHKVTDFTSAVQQTAMGKPKVAVFDESFWTIAEYLRQIGYATAGIVANPFILSEFGFAQGFDHFDTSHTGNWVSGDVINEAAFAWLEQRPAGKPFFLYLHYMDAHGPYPISGAYLMDRLAEQETQTNKRALTVEEFKALNYLLNVNEEVEDKDRHRRLGSFLEYWEARYDTGVYNADRYFADLRARLESLSLWEDTLTIVVSDHGEQFLEHGQWDHGQSVYDIELHVPLLWHAPRSTLGGKRITETVRLVDVLPSLLESLRIEPKAEMQGRSFLNLMGNMAEPAPRLTFSESTRQPPEQKAVQYGPWKLIGFWPEERFELYNLEQDPQESSDLAGEDPETLATLQAILSEQLADNLRLGEGLTPQRTTVTPEQLRRLRDLGYVGN